MAIKFPFIGGAYQGSAKASNPQECVNLMFVPDVHGGKSSLMGTPGLIEWMRFETGVDEVRGMYRMGEYLLVVIGKWLYKVNKGKDATRITNGDEITSKKGQVTFAGDGAEVIITDGEDGWAYRESDDSLKWLDTRPIDGDPPGTSFQGGGQVTYIDGLFINVPPDSNTFWYSFTPREWDVLSYYTVDNPAGDIVRILEDHRELWIFKENSINVYDFTGYSDQAFRQRRGAEMTVGLRSKFGVAQVDNTLYWLADDNTIRRAEGYVPRPVSTPQISYQISTYKDQENAIAFGFEQDGQSYFQITFPLDRVTWLYEVSTGIWTKRASYQVDQPLDGRHRANCYAFFDGKHLMGDYENGKIYEHRRGVYTDNNNTVRRKRTCSVIDTSRELLSIPGIEIRFEPGVGIPGSGQGNDPQAMLRWSTDAGHTWSNERWAGIGGQGEYGVRALWRQLGRGRDWVFEFTISDPVEVVITDAFIHGRKIIR